jgi:hydrophobic/amphiphilic exporter-1 (mainly G- bacteria), HAE1 family
MNVSRPFIERPVATSLLMAALLLVGIVAYRMLPVAPLPQVDFPTIQVSASLPGASPETMASTVAAPLERQLGQIPAVSQMTSTSYLGSTSITIQFDLDRDIDAAAQDVQAALAAASGQLPHNLPSAPSYRKVNPADAPILIYAVQSDTLPLTQVDDYAENVLVQQLSQIDGVGQVSLGGQQKPAVRVQVDPAKLMPLGVDLSDISAAITTASVNAPKGSLNGAKRSLAIYDNDQLTSAAPWNDVIVKYNGAPVRIRDIGKAVDGAENIYLSAWQNGKPGILLIIFKEPGANVVATVARVDAALAQMKSALPQAIQVHKLIDRTQTIRASVTDVKFTLSLSVALVVMVMFLFLRNLSATLIPSITVPLALFGAAALMYEMHYSLDNLSLMGLTIAIGFVVDDAIVMLENIHRHIDDGMEPMQAAIQGAREVGFTIVAMSISLVAVFIPLLLMSGILGRLFREMAVTVCMAVLISMVVSLTLTPMMCSRLLRKQIDVRHGRLYVALERAFDVMREHYRRALDFALGHRQLTLGVFLASCAATILLALVIPKGFFPQQDTGIITGTAEGAQDVSFAEMVRLTRALTDVVGRDPDVAGWGASIGGGRTQNNAQVFITLKPRSERTASADQIITRLQTHLAAVPGAKLFLQAAQDLNLGGRAARTQYQYTLRATDLNDLNTWAQRLQQELQSLPELTGVATDQQTSGRTLTLTIDRNQAARFGITPDLIDQTLYSAFGQRQVAQYFTQLNSYNVILEVDPRLQGDPATLQQIYITSPLTGQSVPLSAFARYDTNSLAYLSVAHQSQFPAVTLSFNLAPGVALGQAVTAIEAAVARIHMPDSITGSFQGAAQAFQDSLASQPYLILAAIAAIYIVLGVLYESYVHPLTIISTLPSAGLGALLTLMLFHTDLSVVALIGVILLIGIVKKNGIMMVDVARVAEQEQGLSAEQAIRHASLLRFRPIMMTTMAALLGALPLMLEHGTGSELRRPLGYTLVGGLIVSQALTLFTTPVIYLYLDRLNTWITRRMNTRMAQSPTTVAEALPK